MPLDNLTEDEEHLRSYYLNVTPSRWDIIQQELPYFGATALFAVVATCAETDRATAQYLWLAVIAAVVSQAWRVRGGRWTNAMLSLVRKYEERVTELEQANPGQSSHS